MMGCSRTDYCHAISRDRNVADVPAIDPDRLARQMEDLMAQSSDPNQIAREVMVVLEEYSEPAKPSTPSVPAPVIRSLRTALHHHEEPIAIAEALWKKGLPDARLLAAGLLEAVEDSEVAIIAESWAAGRVLIEIVRELGERGVSGWRRVDPSRFLNQIEKWLKEDRRRSQVLAIYALRARVQDDDFEDLPTALEMVEGRFTGARGEIKEALIYLVLEFAEVAPEETAIFLNDEDSSPLVKRLQERLNSQTVGVV